MKFTNLQFKNLKSGFREKIFVKMCESMKNHIFSYKEYQNTFKRCQTLILK